MTLRPREVANIDPDDGYAHVDAIRELAEAIADLQTRLLVLETEVEELRTAVTRRDDEASAETNGT